MAGVATVEASRAGDIGGGHKAARGGAHRAAPLTQRQLARLVSRLSGCLSSVTPRQRQLLALRTGYALPRSYDRGQVARILGVSRQRESQIEQAAVAGLQQASQRSNCASAARSIPAIAIAVASAPFEILDRAFGPGLSEPANTSARGSHTTAPKLAAHNHPAPQPQAQGVNPAGSAGKSAVISPPAQGGIDWLLLAVALASLAAAAAAVVARRRLHSARIAGGPAVGALGWRPGRVRLSPLVGAVASLPALVAGGSRRRSRERDGEATRALLEPPAPGTTEPPVPAEPLVGKSRHREALAAFALASTLEREGDFRGAQDAYRHAHRLGHSEAAFNLGGMFAEQGDFDGALEEYRHAEELGHAAAAFNLGVLLEHRSDWTGAEAAYSRADELGSGLGAFNLGVLLENRGDSDGAKAAYQRADERGDAGGAYSLGNVLAEKGDLTGAERAFYRADTRGHAAAAFNVGGMLVEQGDLTGAEAAYRRADERGHAAGAFNLGVLLEERGELVGAEAAYRRAQERGHGEMADMARAALLELEGRR